MVYLCIQSSDVLEIKILNVNLNAASSDIFFTLEGNKSLVFKLEESIDLTFEVKTKILKNQ